MQSSSFRQIIANYPIEYLSGSTFIEIGRAHVWTPVTRPDLVCRLLLEKKKKTKQDRGIVDTPTILINKNKNDEADK